MAQIGLVQGRANMSSSIGKGEYEFLNNDTTTGGEGGGSSGGTGTEGGGITMQ